MSSKSKKESSSSKWFEFEHILCERPTIKPWPNKGSKQYLIKYWNYDFHDCYWVHAPSIKPHGVDSIFWKWNQLTDQQKHDRYNFLNEPREFMKLSDRQKIQLGWKYVEKYSLNVFSQTPDDLDN